MCDKKFRDTRFRYANKGIETPVYRLAYPFFFVQKLESILIERLGGNNVG